MSLCLAAIALGGCAAPPTIIFTNPPAARIVSAAKFEVDDFATAKQVREADGVYFTGWFPIADRWVEPAFHEAITAKVKGGLIPIRIKNDNCVASPCRAAALSAASRLVLLSNANWN